MAGISRLQNQINANLKKNIYKVGGELVIELKSAMKEKKTGRAYWYYTAKRKRKVIASAPNEIIAKRSGNYEKQIGFNGKGNDLYFGNNSDYASIVELGSKKMAPRYPLRRTVLRYLEKKSYKLVK